MALPSGLTGQVTHCPHCQDGTCPGPGSTDIAAWDKWIEDTPRGNLPAWAQVRKDSMEFRDRWNPYRLFDLGIDIQDEPESNRAADLL